MTIEAVQDPEVERQAARQLDLRRGSALAGFGLAIALIPTFLLSPNVQWPHHDGAIFGTIGEGLTRGLIPYRDLWDHKPPGIYLVGALAALLPGTVWPAFWALSVVTLAATGTLMRLVVGIPVALLATASLALYPVALGGGYTETFGALPAVAGIVLATRSRPFSAGIATALAVLFSLQYLPMAIAMLFLARPPRYLAGLGATFAGAAIVLALAGALNQAWDALITYSFTYLGSSASADPIWHIPLVLAPVASLALLRGSWRLTPTERFAAIWLIVGVVALASQGRHLGHHATPLILATAILGARAGQRALMFAATVVVIVIAVTATMVFYPQSGPATTSVGGWVASHTARDDPILVWGVESNVYLVAQRQVAGRYPYLMPLVTPGYSTPQQIKDWIADLDADPPAVIVDAESAVGYWPEDDDFLRPPPPGAAGGRNLDILGPFREWVRDHYELATEIEGRKIYVRVD